MPMIATSPGEAHLKGRGGTVQAGTQPVPPPLSALIHLP
jgi:hypothetical protein